MRIPFADAETILRTIRPVAAAILVIAIATACDSMDVFDDEVTQGQPIVEGFFGGVAGDEPRAVLTARSTLAAGGSAADAAIAYYFTSAVTYPAASSLAAGGACMAYSEGKNQAQFIDFRDGVPAASPEGEFRPTAVPGAVRGLFALHARMGSLPWNELVTPAERMARFGHPVSRALARDLALVGEALVEDPGARAIFTHPDGTLLQEGDDLVQLDLSIMLSYIRTRGAGDFYSGLGATQFVDAVQSIDNRLSLDDMRAYQPHWRDTYSVPVPVSIIGAEAQFQVPGPAFDAGAASLWIWDMYALADRFARAGPAERAHLDAEAALRAAVARTMAPDAAPEPEGVALLMASFDPDRATPLDALPAEPSVPLENPASTSVAVLDAFGNAVACVFSMNSLFGIGRVAPGTGIVLAARPGGDRGDGASLLPVVIANDVTGDVSFVGAVSGGIVSAPVLTSVIASAIQAGMPLDQAVAQPRVFDPGLPNVVIVEPDLPAEIADSLVAKGHELRVAPELGRVNAIYCPGGAKGDDTTCTFANDPRGFGLAVGG